MRWIRSPVAVSEQPVWPQLVLIRRWLTGLRRRSAKRQRDVHDRRLEDPLRPDQRDAGTLVGKAFAQDREWQDLATYGDLPVQEGERGNADFGVGQRFAALLVANWMPASRS